MRERVATYKPGDTFTCVARTLVGAGETAETGKACGAEIVMHGAFWVPQRCPECLQAYNTGPGADTGLYVMPGWLPAEAAERLRGEIAANGGQYVPNFDRR